MAPNSPLPARGDLIIDSQAQQASQLVAQLMLNIAMLKADLTIEKNKSDGLAQANQILAAEIDRMKAATTPVPSA